MYVCTEVQQVGYAYSSILSRLDQYTDVYSPSLIIDELLIATADVEV